MKTLGLVGGIGPESTMEYYRFLIAEYRARVPPESGYPTLFVNSIDLSRMIGYVERGELETLATYLAGEVSRLADAGVAFAAFASNTPHIVFDEVRRLSPIPLVSIVEATRDDALARGFKRVGLFGTRFTMQAPFYSRVFREREIDVVVPAPEEQAYIHEKYFSELVKGVAQPETRDRLMTIARRLAEREQVQGVILGGTELPLILRGAPDPGVPFLDTTMIHVKRLVAEMLS